MSMAVPPVAAGMFFVEYTVRSGWTTVSSRSAVTLCVSRLAATVLRPMVPSSTIGLKAVIATLERDTCTYPSERMRTTYVPGESPSTLKLPSSRTSAPLAKEESLARRTVMAAVGTARPLTESTTLPRISPGPAAAARGGGAAGGFCAWRAGADNRMASDSAVTTMRDISYLRMCGQSGKY